MGGSLRSSDCMIFRNAGGLTIFSVVGGLALRTMQNKDPNLCLVEM